MAQKICLFLAILFATSCGPPEFEKNTRILVKGIVVDENERPIPNMEINVFTKRFIPHVNDKQFLLGKSFSETDGSFQIISLVDRNEDFFIEINGNEKYSNYIYKTNTNDYLPSDLTFNLQRIILKKVSKVNYSISKESTSDIQFWYAFKFISKDCTEFFNKEVLSPNYSNCFGDYETYNVLNESNPSISTSFLTIKGSMVEFRYVKNDEPEVVETFSVNDENHEFNFSY